MWLRSLGLGKYEAVFRENDIDETVLPSLTHGHLKDPAVQRRERSACERGSIGFCEPMKQVFQLLFACPLPLQVTA